MRTSVERSHFKKDERAEATSVNLYKPIVLGYGISGGWTTPVENALSNYYEAIHCLVFASLIIAWRWTRIGEPNREQSLPHSLLSQLKLGYDSIFIDLIVARLPASHQRPSLGYRHVPGKSGMRGRQSAQK